MAVSLARLRGRISTLLLIRNMVLVTLTNFAGALFVVYFFGHVLGLTGEGIYLDQVVDMAGHKLEDSFLQAFISAIGCNWLVALAVWLSYAADTMSGKLLGIWIPTAAFVAIGFQHVVANMFLIPAAIFEGHYSWSMYLANYIPVWLGTGGAVFVAGAYYLAYLHEQPQGRSLAEGAKDHTKIRHV
ncbi:formate/nitrite transporter [Paenibacillus sp. 453mf]|nr:formate/nitrite transporter [Paenibacillus sp. 453mf]